MMVKGDRIALGKYGWQVLSLNANKVLVITEDIVELRWYHTQFVNVTWAKCALRAYLNHVFYQDFSLHEQAAILPVTHSNPDNPWFGTAGGPATTDRIFLLSLAEACTYFGDSRANLETKGNQMWCLDDEHNAARQATYGAAAHGWRLRSPGYYGRTAAGVSANGGVYVRGTGVHGRPRDGGGIRPALWLKRESYPPFN
jgi:hypothetical protein